MDVRSCSRLRHSSFLEAVGYTPTSQVGLSMGDYDSPLVEGFVDSSDHYNVAQLNRQLSWPVDVGASGHQPPLFADDGRLGS